MLRSKPQRNAQESFLRRGRCRECLRSVRNRGRATVIHSADRRQARSHRGQRRSAHAARRRQYRPDWRSRQAVPPSADAAWAWMKLNSGTEPSESDRDRSRARDALEREPGGLESERAAPRVAAGGAIGTGFAGRVKPSAPVSPGAAGFHGGIGFIGTGFTGCGEVTFGAGASARGAAAIGFGACADRRALLRPNRFQTVHGYLPAPAFASGYGDARSSEGLICGRISFSGSAISVLIQVRKFRAKHWAPP